MKIHKNLLIFLRVTSVSLIYTLDENRDWVKDSIFISLIFFEILEVLVICKLGNIDDKYKTIQYITNIIISALIFELSIHYGFSIPNFISNILLECFFSLNNEKNTQCNKLKAQYILPLLLAIRVLILLIMTQQYNLLIQIYILMILFSYELFSQIWQKVPGSLKYRQTTLDYNDNQIDIGQKSPIQINENPDKFHEISKQKINSDKLNSESFSIQRLRNFNSPNNNFLDVKSKSIFRSQLSSVNNSFFQQVLNVLPYGCIVLNAQCEVVYKNYKLSKIFESKNENDILGEISKLIKGSKISSRKSVSQSGKNIKPSIFKLNSVNPGSMIFQSQGQDDDWRKIGQLSCVENLVERSRQCSIQQSNFDIISSNQKMNSFVRLSYQMKDDLGQIKYFKIKVYNSIEGSSLNNLHTSFLTLILIKNVSKKKELSKIKKQHKFQNQLLESFSHELRTPLNCSIQSIQAVIQIGVSRQLETLLNSALGSNYLLLHQINDILDTAAMQNGNFTYKQVYFSISEIINEINSIYLESLKIKNITLKTNLNKLDLYNKVKSDKSRILQILVNLMNNSIKFTKQGGIIQLNIDFIQRPDFSQSIKFELKDNGIGIDTEKLKNIKTNLSIACSPGLQKAEINEQFMGLGLTICSKLAQGLSLSSDTNLQVKSSQSHGTLVYFFVDDQNIQSTNNIQDQIPEYRFRKSSKILEDKKISDSNLNKDYEIQIKVPELSLCFDKVNIQKEKMNSRMDKYFRPSYKNLEQVCKQCTQILIVDDVPFNHIALKAMLSAYYLQCDSAYDGIQAIQMVQTKLNQHCKTYRLILMDIEMPKMNGFQTTNRIKEMLGISLTCHIIMCSAYDSAENVSQAVECGMSGFLFKPVRAENLKHVLQKYKCYGQR